MPNLVRLYLNSMSIGFAVAIGFTGLLLWQDVAGLGRLIAGSDIGWIAGVMLVLFNGLVFSAAQFARAVMGLADELSGPHSGLGHRSDMIPVRVEVTARR